MAPNPLDHPVLSALFRYWDNKRDGRMMPDRRDIDPLEMGGHLLPHLLLCDLRDRGRHVRFRLVGTKVVKRFGCDPTGQNLEDQLSGEAGGDSYFEALAALHLLSFAERAPVYSESRFRWDVNRTLDLCHVLLPMTNGSSAPGISLMGLVARSENIFAPPLRRLSRPGQHVELCRTVLEPQAPVMTLTARLGAA